MKRLASQKQITCDHCNYECGGTCSRARAEQEFIEKSADIPKPEWDRDEFGMSHLWDYWTSYENNLRQCQLCGKIEMYGELGGWSKVY